MVSTAKITGNPPKKGSAERRRENATKLQKEKEAYLVSKARILEREEENYTKLALVYSGEGFWKLFDHSALIYKHVLAPRLGLEPKLKTDEDYGKIVAKYGVVTINNFDKFEQRMTNLGVRRSYKKGRIAVFLLGEKIGPEKMKELYTYEADRWERANRLVMPVNVMPALRARIRDVAVCVHEMVRKLDGTARDSYGTDMDKISAKMLSDFLMMANGWKDCGVYLNETLKGLHTLNARLAVTKEFRLVKPDKVFQLMDFINKAQTKVIEEIKRNDRKQG